MKKLLLTASLLVSFAFLLSVNGQAPNTPDLEGPWKYQPVKMETWLYNLDIFDEFGLSGRVENDSVPESLTEFEYDNDLITTTSLVWMDGDWKSQLQTQLYLNNDSQIDSMIMAVYDTTLTVWDNNFKIESDYENGMQVQTRSYTADSLTGEWDLFSQTDYNYNESDYLTEEIRSAWSADSNKLITSSKTEYYVSSEGRTDSTKEYFWLPIVNQWQVSTHTEYMYSNDGTVEERVRYERSLLTQEWNKTRKTELHYNTEGNQYFRGEYNWDTMTELWLLTDKDSTIYEDGTKPLVQINYQKPLLENKVHVYSKTFFTYDEASSAPETLVGNDILVYPNPATDFISVQTKRPEDYSVRLFNLSGKLVYENTATEKTTQIAVHHLTEGSYLLKVSSGNSAHSQIVIVR